MQLQFYPLQNRFLVIEYSDSSVAATFYVFHSRQMSAWIRLSYNSIHQGYTLP